MASSSTLMASLYEEYAVIVVGAGMAGLGACRTLIEAGVTDILLLEGQERPGGRVQSLPLKMPSSQSPELHDLPLASSQSAESSFSPDVCWLELGAQWLHGQGSHLYEIAKSNGLLSNINSSEGLGQYLKENGEEIETSLVAEVSNCVADILEECEQFWYEDNISEIPSSVGQYLLKRFNEYLSCCDDSPQIRQNKIDLFDWHVRFQVIDNSCENLDDLSAKSWGRYKFCGGEDYINFKSGYSSLIDNLVNDLPEGVLKLNTIVTNVRYGSVNKEITATDNNSYTLINNMYYTNHKKNDNYISLLSSPASFPPVMVTCSDGAVYCCQHIIVTSSLGYLKKNHLTMFQPPLPDMLIKSINDIGYSVINKIFLCYDKQWWHKDQRGFQILWASVDNRGDDCMKLLPEQMWMRDISGFDVLPNIEGVLLGWIGRGGAIAIEQLTEKEIGKQCTLLLRHFTRKNDIPLPNTVVRSAWHNNQLVCGGYSHLTTKCDLSSTNKFIKRNKNCGTDDEKDDVYDDAEDFCDSKPENLARPVYVQTLNALKHPAILLAGEATHEKYFSTTHGAFESGQRQANRILKFINSQKDMPCSH